MIPAIDKIKPRICGDTAAKTNDTSSVTMPYCSRRIFWETMHQQPSGYLVYIIQLPREGGMSKKEDQPWQGAGCRQTARGRRR